MHENFLILKLQAALECPMFPVNPWGFRVLEVWSTTILAYRLIHGTHGVPVETFLKVHLLARGHSQHYSRIQRIWQRLLADWRQSNTGKNSEQGEGARQKPQSFTIPTPRFARDEGNLSRTGGIYPKFCMMETPRCSISEVHLWKCSVSVDFQCWKVSFKTEVCAKHTCPTLTKSWIKEMEMA